MVEDAQAVIWQQRAAIEAAEQLRALPLPRPPQWDAAQWQHNLGLLINAEHRRDTALIAQIDQTAHVRDWQLGWEQMLTRELDGDVVWLQRLNAQLYGLQLGWGGRDPGDGRVGELNRHRQLLYTHLLARQVWRAEVALWSCELQRRAAGWLPNGQWDLAWGVVQAAWVEQDAFFQQISANRQELNAERLAWLQKISTYQQGTIGAMAPGSPGYAALNQDATTVAATLSAYNSTSALNTNSGGGGGGLAAVLIIALIIGGIALAGNRAPGGSQPAPPAPVAEAQGAPPAAEPPQPTLAALIPASQAADLIVAGQQLRREGRCAEAAPLFEQAIVTDPAMFDGYSALAFCLYDLGRVDEAIRRWEEALLRSPQDPDALAGLGMAQYAQGAQDVGMARFREAVAIEPRYLDEGFLRAERGWSDAAIAASQPLRQALVP